MQKKSAQYTSEGLSLFLVGGILLFLTHVISIHSLHLSLNPDGLIIWVPLFLVVSLTSLHFWRDDKMPKEPWMLFMIGLGGVLMCAVMFGVDSMIGQSIHPELPWFDAATKSPSAFGIVFTVGCALTIPISFLGAVRALIEKLLLDSRHTE